MADSLSYARMIDAFPNVANTSDRDVRFPAPTTYQKIFVQSLNSIQQWDGAAWTTVFTGVAGVGAYLFAGTGNPEGVQVAPVSAVYLQTDGVNGGTLWVKRTGSGNTGWVLISTSLGMFNVKDYGALGDGATDDTAAIQAALTAAGAAAGSGAGGKVLVPSGQYAISASLTWPTAGRVTLCGPAGWQSAAVGGAVLKLAAGANCSMITLGAVSQWCIRDLELSGRSASQAGTSHGIAVTAVSNFANGLIENVFIEDFRSDGISVGAGQRCVYTHQCYIYGCGGNGIHLNGSSSDCKVTNSLLGGHTGYGIDLEGIANVVQGCDIYLNVLGGLHLSSARNSVVGNLFDTNPKEAIIIDGVGVTVVGNCFDSNATSINNTYATIRVEDSREAKNITGNTFTNTSAQANLPSYHIKLSAGTYRVNAANNGMVTGTAVGGFSNAPTRLDHGEPVALYAVAAHPDADGTRSIGDDVNARGWLELIIRHTSANVNGILLKQTNAGVSSSPKMFFVGGSGVAWAIRNDAGQLQFFSGGTYGSATGTQRLNLTTVAFTPAVAGAITLGTSGFPFGSAFATRVFGAGTAHVAGDYALSAGWGSTATVSTIAARDTGGRVSITCNGASIAANPTVTLTWKDGSWTTVPSVVASRSDAVMPVGPFLVTTPAATTCVFTFNGLPVAGSIYVFDFIAIGK